MMRRLACVGDRLERGGRILPAAGSVPMLGEGNIPLASIGGLAYCAACNMAGAITKAGGPRRLGFTAEVALDGDLVLCRCGTPPRVVARLGGDRWYDDAGEGDARPNANAAMARGDSDKANSEDVIEQHFELRDGITGEPVDGYRYDLFAEGKRVATDATFSNGRTVSVNSAGLVSLVAWIDTGAKTMP